MTTSSLPTDSYYIAASIPTSLAGDNAFVAVIAQPVKPAISFAFHQADNPRVNLIECDPDAVLHFVAALIRPAPKHNIRVTARDRERLAVLTAAAANDANPTISLQHEPDRTEIRLGHELSAWVTRRNHTVIIDADDWPKTDTDVGIEMTPDEAAKLAVAVLNTHYDISAPHTAIRKLLKEHSIGVIH